MKAPTAEVLEAVIVKNSIAVLRKLPHCWAQKRHGSPMGIAGDPDVTGAIFGIRFELECKRPGRHLTALQEERIKRWASVGCITGVFHTPEEAVTLVLEGARLHIQQIRQTAAEYAQE